MFKNMSKVTCTHWFEFFVRLILLIGLLISYLVNVHIFGVSLFGLLLVVFFGLYIYEFVVRLFPRQLGSNTSMGAKKYKFGPISFGDGSLDAIVDIRNRKYSRGRLFSVLFYLCVTHFLWKEVEHFIRKQDYEVDFIGTTQLLIYTRVSDVKLNMISVPLKLRDMDCRVYKKGYWFKDIKEGRTFEAVDTEDNRRIIEAEYKD